MLFCKTSSCKLYVFRCSQSEKCLLFTFISSLPENRKNKYNFQTSRVSELQTNITDINS